MSEQVILDREGPPWAQRLQTDINAALMRLDRRVTTLKDTGWQAGEDLTIDSSVSSIEFSVPESARYIKIEGICRPTVQESFLIRSGPSSGSYYSGGSDYLQSYLLAEAATAAAGTFSATGFFVPYIVGTDTYSDFSLGIMRAPSLDRIRFSAVSTGFYSGTTPYTIHRSGVGYSPGSGSNRFFVILPVSAPFADFRARVEYRT